MRKVAVIIIIVILLLGVSGCDNVPAVNEEMNMARDAYYIVYAINIYHALNPSEVTDFESLDKTKKHIGEQHLWPAGLSDEEERTAWELIVIEDWAANLTTEAQKALQEGNGDESAEDIIMNSAMIVAGINAYNALNPHDNLPDDVTSAEVKEALERERIWPSLLTDTEVEAAWELIEIKDGVATVKGKG